MARLKSLPDVPMGLEPSLRNFLLELRDFVSEFKGSITPPEEVENFRVTPVAGGNLIEFTRSNAEIYILHWNTENNYGSSNAIPLGSNIRYEHFIGSAGVTVYYWIEARQFNGLIAVTGPISGTTLNLGTSVPFANPPSPGVITYQQEGGEVLIGSSSSELPRTV